jgi:hypothetical protein
VLAIPGVMVQLNLELQSELDAFQSPMLLMVRQLWTSNRVMQRMRLLEVALEGKVRFMWLKHNTRKIRLCHVWIQMDGRAPRNHKKAAIADDIKEAARVQQGVEPNRRLLQPQQPDARDKDDGDRWQDYYNMGIMPGEASAGMLWQTTAWDSTVFFRQNQRFVVIGRSDVNPVAVTTAAAFMTAGAALWDPSAPGWSWTTTQLLEKYGEIVPLPLRRRPRKRDARAVVWLLQLLKRYKPEER